MNKKSFKALLKLECFSSALLQVPFTLSDWTILHNRGADKSWLPNNSCIPFRQVHGEDRNARPSWGAAGLPQRPNPWNLMPPHFLCQKKKWELHFLVCNWPFPPMFSKVSDNSPRTSGYAFHTLSSKYSEGPREASCLLHQWTVLGTQGKTNYRKNNFLKVFECFQQSVTCFNLKLYHHNQRQTQAQFAPQTA